MHGASIHGVKHRLIRAVLKLDLKTKLALKRNLQNMSRGLHGRPVGNPNHHISGQLQLN